MEIDELLFNVNAATDSRCRICLENAEGTICLQEFANPKIGELTYWDILLRFCVIETENNINAPRNICSDCAKKTESCYGFKVLCESSDKVLKEELSSISLEDGLSSPIVETDENIKVEIFEEKCIPNPEDSTVNKLKEGDEDLEDFTKRIEDEKYEEKTESVKSINEEITLSDNSNDTNFEFDGDNTEHDAESKFSTPLTGDDFISLSSDDEETRCEVCKMNFENESLYKEHINRMHLNKDTFEMMSCGYKPKSLDDYNKHMMKHKKKCRNNRRHKCPHCGGFYRGQNLINHMLKEHGDKKIGCVYCEEHIFKPNVLIRHMKLNHPDCNIVCKLCDFQSEVHDLYYEHMMESHRNFFQVKKCDFCEYTTISVISLGKHMATLHEDKKTLKCEICGKNFFNEKTRIRHVKSHEEATRFYCETCGKSYKYKRDLNNHMDGHSNDKVIECNICQKKFNRIDNYMSHKRSHNEDRSFKCEECGSCFKRRQVLNNHIDRVHKKIKKCECSICFKKFSTGNELKVHMKRHTGLKEIQCKFCEKCFCRNWELKQHMVVHTGERRFVCEVCGKGFTQAQVLRGHMKTHNKN